MYNRVAVIGGPGSGKTTLSDKLSKLWNIPVTHIDGIHHLPNWQIRDKDERDAMILDIVKNEKWIIDGNYKATLQKRLEAADLVIWLDYPTRTMIKGILKRYLSHPGKEKAEIPGCNEKMDFTFFFYTLNYRKNKRHFAANLVKQLDHSKVIIFNKQKDLNKWLRNEEKKYEHS